MKPLFILALFTMVLPFTAADQRLSVEDVSVIPLQYSIGEPVTLRITVRAASPLPEDLPVSVGTDDWVEVRSIDSVRKGERLSVFIQFVPYYPGKRYMPELTIGGQVMPPVLLEPVLFLEHEEQDFYPIRSQLLIPGTKLVILAVSLSFFLLCGLAVLIFKKLRPFMIWAGKKIGRVRFIFQRREVLKILQEEYKEMPQAEVYARLVLLLRTMLTVLFGISAAGMTGSELARVLQSAKDADNAEDAGLKGMLQRSDSVRFGGREYPDSQISADIQIVDFLSSSLLKSGQTGAFISC